MSRIHIVELLGSKGFPLAESVYGQSILKLDLLKYFKVAEGRKIQWHLLGASISKEVTSSNTDVHSLNRDGWNENVYLKTIEEICSIGEPVIVVSSFAHEEQDQILTTARYIKQRFDNARIVIVLHCPYYELVRPVVKVLGGGTEKYGTPDWHNAARQKWLNLFSIDLREDIIDSWVAVSEEVLNSFLEQKPIPIEEDKIRIITNGVDEHLYNIPDDSKKSALRARFKIGNELVVGTTAGYKQQKGDVVMKGILKHYAGSPDTSPYFMFPVLPDYAGVRLVTDLVHPTILPLLQSGKVRLYFDDAKWNGFGDKNAIEKYYYHVFLDAVEQAPSHHKELMSAWMGVLNFSVQLLFDVYIRPSLSEAFGRGSVEAGLSGNTLLVSDRGYMKHYSFEKNVIHLGKALQLQHRDEESSVIYANEGHKASSRFIKRIEEIRAYPAENLNPILNRELCMKSCPTVEDMVSNWAKLVSELAQVEVV